MEKADSRECRNCHAYEAMAFEHQAPDASQQMQAAWANGETCISCHKGVAHKLPDLSKGYADLYADLEANAAGQAMNAGAFHTIRTQDAFRAAGDVDGGRAVGRLLPATEMTVLGREGDAVQVRIEGWQQDGADRVLYALMGRRILSVALSPDATDLVERHESRVDTDTGLTWHRVSADLWIAPGGAVTDQKKLWAYAAAMHNAACSTCHALGAPEGHLANQWIGVLKSMERFSTLDKEQTRMLEKYLQLHAGDVVGGRGAEPAGG
jgi:trimethylamine-N-oxide reductase cytochrome c-type subunit TorC